MPPPPPSSTLFPYTTLFRSKAADHVAFAEAAHLLGVGLDDGLPDRNLPVASDHDAAALADGQDGGAVPGDRKSTRLNSSHVEISYAVFCLKKKKRTRQKRRP